MSRLWDIESMKDILERNDDQVGKALMKLYEYQTEDEKKDASAHEHNGVGFNKYDAEILSSFAQAYKKFGRLTANQLTLARKRIMKYAKQLVNIANYEQGVVDKLEAADEEFKSWIPEQYRHLVATPTSTEVHPGYTVRTYSL